MSKRQRVSTTNEALYNGFHPVPIKVQDRDTISKKTVGKGKGKASDITAAVHYLWIRQHRATKNSGTTAAGTDPASESALPSSRTLFVANLPVDTTERDVRLMFGTYGGIDRVEFKVGEIGRMGREGDPWWTVEDDEEMSDSDDEDEDEDEDEGAEDDSAAAEEPNAPEGTDPAESTMTKRQRRRVARKQERADPEFAINAMRRKAPQVVPLPPLNPRTSANGQGYLAPCSGCYVVFLDDLSVTRCLELAGSKGAVKTWERSTAPSKTSQESDEPTGLTYYRRLHALLRPPLDIIKKHADTSIALFDWHSNLSTERAKRGAITDEDGFTLVVRGGKFGRTAGKGEKGVAVASRRFMLDSKKAVKKNVVGASAEEMGREDDVAMLDAREGLTRGKKRKAQQLEGFYKFQRDEQRRSREFPVTLTNVDYLLMGYPRSRQHSSQFRGRQGQGGNPQGCQAIQALLDASSVAKVVCRKACYCNIAIMVRCVKTNLRLRNKIGFGLAVTRQCGYKSKSTQQRTPVPKPSRKQRVATSNGRPPCGIDEHSLRIQAGLRYAFLPEDSDLIAKFVRPFTAIPKTGRCFTSVAERSPSHRRGIFFKGHIISSRPRSTLVHRTTVMISHQKDCLCNKIDIGSPSAISRDGKNL